MKWVMVMILAMALGTAMGAEETNVFTITNATGRVYENVRILKNNGDGLFYLGTNGTSGGKILFRELDPETAAKFGYNEVSEAVAMERGRQDRERTAAMYQAAANAAAAKKRAKELESTRMVIEGRVLQKTKAGLLVDGMSEVRRRWDLERGSVFEVMRGGVSKAFDGTVQLYDGTCLLLGYKGFDRAVDGDLVHVEAFPDGEFEYTTVLGAKKNVRRFQVRAVDVSEPADAATMREIKGATHR